jgi:hypothetical protein
MDICVLDWKECAVLLSAILTIGCFADLLVINEEWEKVKFRLFKTSLNIKNSSLNELMFILSRKVVNLLEGTTAYSFKNTNKKTSKRVKAFTWFGVILTSILFFYILIFKPDYLASMVLVIPILSIGFFWVLVIIFYELTTGKWNETNDKLWRAFTKTAFISACITFVAVIIGSELYQTYGLSEYWFHTPESKVTAVIKHKEFIGLINYPFDFLSLAFTYYCVKRIASKKRFYSVLPLFDIAFSLTLSCLLYIVLFSISKGSFSYALLTVDINNMFWGGPETTQFDLIYLLPIIMSTFIPISLLGIIFFILMFYKLVSLFLARILHVFSEKQGSIFKDIAATLSAFIALANALSVL